MEMGRKYNSMSHIESYCCCYKSSSRLSGGIIHLEALGKHIIVLNTVEDADELLEKRTNNYSNRPVMPMTKL